MALARSRLEAVNAEPIPEPAADPADRAADEGTFRREGDLWRVAWAGREITVRPSKGVVDLSRLLAEPGREIHCLELAGAGAEQAGTGEVIDDTARREFSPGAAISNAVCNAIGVRVPPLPMTPQRVLEAMQKAGRV